MALSAEWAAATMASQYSFATQSAVIASLKAVCVQGHVTQTYVGKRKNSFLSFCEHSFPADFCSMFTVFHAAACLHLSCVEHLQRTSQFGLSSSGSKCVCMFLCRKLQGSKSTRRNAAREIAAASVVAAAGIYDSMNVAANTVLQSGGQTTSSFIGHKYVPCLQHCGQFFTGSLCSILDHVLC